MNRAELFGALDEAARTAIAIVLGRKANPESAPQVTLDYYDAPPPGPDPRAAEFEATNKGA